MDLKCFVYPGWQPRMRAASVRRQWMDDAPESFAYRCLPLGIANGHGWEVLSPSGFSACWNGGPAPEDVVIELDPGTEPRDAPEALFGVGTLTFHVFGLLRTPPGWNLYVSGPPNSFKDGLAPLTGLIETDWSPYSFTMNWKLTRPDHVVRFEKDEPIAHFFPVPRGAVEEAVPRFVSIEEDPELKEAYEQWSRSRDAFNRTLKETSFDKPADKWQKLYYRGLTPHGECPVSDHKSKLKVREFASSQGVEVESVIGKVAGSSPPVTPIAPAAIASRGDSEGQAMANRMAKYEWLLDLQEKQRALSTRASAIERVANLSSQDFLDAYYAPARPVIITGELESWPASRLWTPEYLKGVIGGREIELQGKRSSSPRFERNKDDHRTRMPFDRFVDMIEAVPGNDAYVTAYNAASNREALRPLDADVRPLDKYLTQSPDDPGGLIWIGPAGTFTALHHDLTNNLLAQVTGHKMVLMAAATNAPRMYNDLHVFSEVSDVLALNGDFHAYPDLGGVRFHEIVLEPGELLFIPIGWWHQVTALDFSVTFTFTNFRWPNAGWQGYPGQG
ncbi:MAG TPA: DUF6065 family protein [Novosphingobium sp.]|nr:DUF6065 family protein [Novosphingobium sp.]